MRGFVQPIVCLVLGLATTAQIAPQADKAGEKQPAIRSSIGVRPNRWSLCPCPGWLEPPNSAVVASCGFDRLAGFGL
jgi:hypothetical protein